jgi:xanthine dehydrogenase accessory factor
MTGTPDGRAPLGREQPWSDDPPHSGRIVAVTDNPIGRAILQVAEIAGRPAFVLADEDVQQSPLEWLAENPLDDDDALVLCDHDTPQMEALLRQAMAGKAGYVAMMGSRRRAEQVFSTLAPSFSAEALTRLRVPAGLNIGGKTPGEIALSVVAEIVAVSHGRDGSPMKPR